MPELGRRSTIGRPPVGVAPDRGECSLPQRPDAPTEPGRFPAGASAFPLPSRPLGRVMCVTSGGPVQQAAVEGRHGCRNIKGGEHECIGVQLVRLGRRGRDARRIDFVEFVQQRSAALFRTAYILTGSQDSAEDLLQEALEKACRHWNRVAVADSPEAYVRRIVVNLANDRWRRLRRIGERSHDVEHADPRDPYRLVDLRDELVQALHTLPIGMRSVVVLHYLHDMGDREIAETLRISPGSVRSQLARGLARLRTAMPQPEPPPPAPDDHRTAPLPQFEGA
ncbi:SigE family RNA polymerase sigma factor [Kitasatospora sp. NPDC018058]|uniref:SigE family RNA polymerase sigma factor n=1 Tax=Kitasatospora sp. NPDC018058 TaxID=3364025 RepID=UPI0037BFE407